MAGKPRGPKQLSHAEKDLIPTSLAKAKKFGSRDTQSESYCILPAHLCQDILSTVYDAIVVTNSKGRIVSWNPAATRVFGYDPDEVVGEPISIIMPPDSKEAFRLRSQENGFAPPHSFDKPVELSGLAKNGSIVPIELTIVPWNRGDEVYFVSTIRDISERKGAELLLLESEQLQSALYGVMREGVCIHELIFDDDGVPIDYQILDANPAYSKLTEIPSSVAVGSLASELYGPGPPFLDIYAEVATTGVSQDFEITWTPQNKTFHVSVFSLRADQFATVFADITARKRAEEALTSSETRYRTLFESTHDASMTLSPPTWKFTSGNHAALNLFGVEDVESFTSNPPWAYSPKFQPDGQSSREKAREMIQKAMSDGSAFFEWTHKKPTGQEFPATVLLTRMELDDKLMLQAVVRDITEQKLAEESLARNEERMTKIAQVFSTLGSNTGENIQKLTALCGELLDADCAFYNCLEGNTLCSLGVWNVPDDYEVVSQAEGHICSDLISYPPDGGQHVVSNLLSSSYAETDSNVRKYGLKTYLGNLIRCQGEPIGTLCVVYTSDYKPSKADRKILSIIATTISGEEERRMAELALRESEERFRDLTEALPQTVYETDLEGRISYANPQAFETFGYPPSIIESGITLANLISQKDWPRLSDSISALRSGGHTSGKEYLAVRSDGTTFPIVVYTRTKKRDNRIIGFRGIAVDITERRKLEVEMQRNAKMKAVGRLAGGIAHDFNNLLMVMVGNASLAGVLTEPGDDEERAKVLSEIERVGKEAKALTDQLLTFAKGGSPVKETASMVELLEETSQLMLRGSNVIAKHNHPSDLWPVDIDRSQIGQVVQNLVVNADQSMPEGGTILLSSRNMSNPPNLPLGDYIELSFTDTGIGIRSNELEEIFEPFYTTKDKGHGLGLATTYRIVKNHGGDIHVKSKLGKGSTFTVYLPAKPGAVPIPSYTPPSNLTTGNARILLMDDEPSVRNSASRMLQRLGYSCTSAINGTDAIEQYRSALSDNAFDLVILDLTVPGGMGGVEALKRLQEIDPNVLAIASSGYTNDDTMAHPKTSGFAGVLPKPYSLQRISDIVAQTLRKQTS
ncbi:MAG: PAS domain S-box protein [Candidatus Micrarchaeota archaeon]